MEPVTTSKLALTFLKLAPRLYKLANEEPKAIRDALAEGYRDFVNDLNQHVEYLATRSLEQGERLENVEARLEAFAEDAQSRRVFHNFGYEAMRESLDERRAMLAAAAANLMLLELPIEAKARCERVLRQLDMRDVLWLAVLDQVCGNIYLGRSWPHGEDAIRSFLLKDCESADALTASGCINTHFVAGAGTGGTELASVTRTGSLILQTLRPWLRGRPLPLADIPGHPNIPGSRTGDEARRFFDEHAPGIRDALRRVGGPGRAAFSAEKCGGKASDLPRFDGKATLHLLLGSGASIEAIPSLRSHDSELQSLPGGAPFNAIVVIRREKDGSADRIVDVYGPRDVLAQIADDIEARWV